METTVKTNVVLSTQDLIVELEDSGGAHVSITLQIGNFMEITHRETYSGSLKKKLKIPKGEYDCTVGIFVFKTGALGPTYDTSVAINGNPIVTAKGAIPTKKDGDHGFGFFQLQIT